MVDPRLERRDDPRRAAPAGARASSSRPARAGAAGPGRAPRRRRCCRRRRPATGRAGTTSAAPCVRRQLQQSLGRELARERLDPEPAAKRSSSSASSIRKASPKRRGSVNQSSRPSSSTKRARTWRGSAPTRALGLVRAAALRGVRGLALALDQHQVAGHPQVHDQGPPALEAQQQVLAAPRQRPRSSRPRPPAPARRAAPAGASARRAPRAHSIRRPSSSGSSWRQTVSTSGSSGIPATDAAMLTQVARGMGLEVDILQLLAGEVGVHLGGRDVGVAEHLLHGAQVAAAGEQVGGEAVAQGVRAHLAARPARGRGAGRSCRGPGGSAGRRGS